MNYTVAGTRQQLTNCVSMLHHSMGLALKGSMKYEKIQGKYFSLKNYVTVTSHGMNIPKGQVKINSERLIVKFIFCNASIQFSPRARLCISLDKQPTFNVS